jgi:hypothetical protein
MMKQLLRLGPLVWPELPLLPRRHDAYDALPRVVAKLGERLDRVDDEVARLPFTGTQRGRAQTGARPGRCCLRCGQGPDLSFVVDGDDVFGGLAARSGLFVPDQFVQRISASLARKSLHALLQKALDVAHRDER